VRSTASDLGPSPSLLGFPTVSPSFTLTYTLPPTLRAVLLFLPSPSPLLVSLGLITSSPGSRPVLPVVPFSDRYFPRRVPRAVRLRRCTSHRGGARGHVRHRHRHPTRRRARHLLVPRCAPPSNRSHRRCPTPTTSFNRLRSLQRPPPGLSACAPRYWPFIFTPLNPRHLVSGRCRLSCYYSPRPATWSTVSARPSVILWAFDDGTHVFVSSPVAPVPRCSATISAPRRPLFGPLRHLFLAPHITQRAKRSVCLDLRPAFPRVRCTVSLPPNRAPITFPSSVLILPGHEAPGLASPSIGCSARSRRQQMFHSIGLGTDGRPARRRVGPRQSCRTSPRRCSTSHQCRSRCRDRPSPREMAPVRRSRPIAAGRRRSNRARGRPLQAAEHGACGCATPDRDPARSAAPAELLCDIASHLHSAWLIVGCCTRAVLPRLLVAL